MKRIQFIRPLVERFREGRALCTYRKDPGAYSGEYQAITSRFQKKSNSDLSIEVYLTEKLVVSELKEKEARLAGLPLKPEELPQGAKKIWLEYPEHERKERPTLTQFLSLLTNCYVEIPEVMGRAYAQMRSFKEKSTRQLSSQRGLLRQQYCRR